MREDPVLSPSAVTIDLEPQATVILLSGGGWTNSFHFGFGKFLQKAFRSDDRALKFGGISGGALVAAALALNRDMDDIHEENMSTHPRYPTREV